MDVSGQQTWLIRLSFTGMIVVAGTVLIAFGDHDAGLGLITLAAGGIATAGATVGAAKVIDARTSSPAPPTNDTLTVVGPAQWFPGTGSPAAPAPDIDPCGT